MRVENQEARAFYIDLKVGKLTHGDLGQLQLYVNYYDRERCATDDNPTLGLILCSDKNDAMVKYTLSAEQQDKIFASRYKLHLPTEAELGRELSQLRASIGSPQSVPPIDALDLLKVFNIL